MHGLKQIDFVAVFQLNLGLLFVPLSFISSCSRRGPLEMNDAGFLAGQMSFSPNQ